MRRVSPLVIVAVLSAFPVAAQESSVADASDRPGFADSPVLLGRGHVQLEFGFTSEHEGGDSGTVRSFTAPQTELHAGVFSRVDVSVSWDGFVSATAPASPSGTEEHDTGYADVRLGAKLALVHRPRLDTALITYVNAPVGSVRHRPLLRPNGTFGVDDRDLGSCRHVGNYRSEAVREDDHLHAKPALSAAVSSTLTAALNGFVGLVAEPASLHSRPNLVSVEAGLVLPFADRNQFDVWVSHRFPGDPDDWFVSAGFVRRLR
jgi:hypothetical protein